MIGMYWLRKHLEGNEIERIRFKSMKIANSSKIHEIGPLWFFLQWVAIFAFGDGANSWNEHDVTASVQIFSLDTQLVMEHWDFTIMFFENPFVYESGVWPSTWFSMVFRRASECTVGSFFLKWTWYNTMQHLTRCARRPQNKTKGFEGRD